MAGRTGRIDRGRNHSYQLDGQSVPGVTSLINDGLPKPAIASWAARTTAEWLCDHLDTIVRDLDRDSLVDLARAAPWRDRDTAANRGQEIHRLAEKLATGTEMTWDEVPEDLRGHLESYLLFREEWRPEDLGVERVVISRRHKYAGTADWFGRFGAAPELGLILGDYKTGRSGVFGEVALQLAAYRFAEFYLDDDGNEIAMPEFDNVVVLWLGPDRYELREVAAGPDTYRAFLYVAQVAQFQTVTSKTALTPPLARPNGQTAP